MTFTIDQKKDFVKLFGGVLKLQNLLSAFDEFDAEAKVISDFDLQDYLTWYNELHDELRPTKGGDDENIEDDLIFEMELVKQIQIDIPYILKLVQEYHDKNCEDKTILAKIQKAINSSPDLRDKYDLIMKFIEKMTPTPDENSAAQGDGDITDEWKDYIDQERERELDELIQEEKLNAIETKEFIRQAFADGYVTTTGTSITKVLPPMPLFGPKANREEKKRTVLDKLTAFFNKFFNV